MCRRNSIVGPGAPQHAVRIPDRDRRGRGEQICQNPENRPSHSRSPSRRQKFLGAKSALAEDRVMPSCGRGAHYWHGNSYSPTPGRQQATGIGFQRAPLATGSYARRPTTSAIRLFLMSGRCVASAAWATSRVLPGVLSGPGGAGDCLEPPAAEVGQADVDDHSTGGRPNGQRNEPKRASV